MQSPSSNPDLASKREALFIINPKSGTGSKEALVSVIQQHFAGSSIQAHLTFTQYAGHATELAREAVQSGFSYAVAVGGDGTMNEVARALVGTKTALGIVPMGSGNGLARHLALPLAIPQALEVINRQKVTQIDSCTLNGRPFFCTAGVGFDAYIGYVFSQQAKRGFQTYVKTTLREYFRYQAKKYRLNLNGQSEERQAFVITFANAGQYGNNAYIAPLADISDGQMDIIVLRPFPILRMPGMGLKLFRKTIHQSGYYEEFRTNRLVLEGENPLQVHIDGEPLQVNGPLEIALNPRSLNVLVP